MTSSNGNIFCITGYLCDLMQSFDVFFELRLNTLLSKQSRCQWFEMPSHPLWRHCNASDQHQLDNNLMWKCWIDVWFMMIWCLSMLPMYFDCVRVLSENCLIFITGDNIPGRMVFILKCVPCSQYLLWCSHSGRKGLEFQCVGNDSTAYIDYMDLIVHSPKKRL